MLAQSVYPLWHTLSYVFMIFVRVIVSCYEYQGARIQQYTASYSSRETEHNIVVDVNCVRTHHEGNIVYEYINTHEQQRTDSHLMVMHTYTQFMLVDTTAKSWTEQGHALPFASVGLVGIDGLTAIDGT